MFKRILLPVDDSAHARAGVTVAGKLCGVLKADLQVVHVLEVPTTAAIAGFAAIAPMPEFPTSSEAEWAAQRIVKKSVNRLEKLGVSAEARVLSGLGSVPELILEAATRFGADVIVMGTRGLSDLQGVVLGSVAHGVIHGSSCPVLVVSTKRKS